MTVHVAGDLRGIQEYIFASPRLLEMRGASAQVDFFDRVVVPRLVGDRRGEAIFSGGGNFLARFEGGDASVRAKDLTVAVRTALFDLTGTSGIVVVSHSGDEPFPEVQAALRRLLRHSKRAGLPPSPAADLPFLKRCESCGREAADVSQPAPGGSGEQWLGPICVKKRAMHALLQKARKRRADARLWVQVAQDELNVEPITEALGQERLPPDFRELAGDDDLALVVADGNGFGDWFEGRDLEGFRELSVLVDRTLRQALDAAASEIPEEAAGRRLQVLICGGDDLVAALPARYGLRFARRLLGEFEVAPPDGVPGGAKGLSVGLVFCGPGFPFRTAHALAEDLLHRAKARCRDEELGSALDLHRVTASHVHSLEAELAAVERYADEERSRGWAYGLAGPYGREEVDDLVRLARELRTATTPSQRGRLREILSPRDDAPGVNLDEARGVPSRVVAELTTWNRRQERRPFDPDSPATWERLLRVERRSVAGRERTVRRFRLADALILADQGEA